MDPESLTIGLLGATLVAKAAERAGEQGVDAASAALTRFAFWLRQNLSGHRSAAALARVEAVPDSVSLEHALAKALDERADADPDFAAELREHVEQARAAGVTVTSISQSAVGCGHVQVANNQGSVSVIHNGPAGPPTSR